MSSGLKIKADEFNERKISIHLIFLVTVKHFSEKSLIWAEFTKVRNLGNEILLNISC